ncbi:hypothetical protein BV25DRAFT_1531118 [Artomyces pyxidatus]|uniref:Uncharacterized protein n=1 Tax=Artomyces pyxidatus TaxID=48021 RepID=A0ACB8TCK3_9AGAM|nr:hypothetical protein BV25DRAFT_1531118 [Artomyces pyxidatus]
MPSASHCRRPSSTMSSNRVIPRHPPFKPDAVLPTVLKSLDEVLESFNDLRTMGEPMLITRTTRRCLKILAAQRNGQPCLVKVDGPVDTVHWPRSMTFDYPSLLHKEPVYVLICSCPSHPHDAIHQFLSTPCKDFLSSNMFDVVIPKGGLRPLCIENVHNGDFDRIKLKAAGYLHEVPYSNLLLIDVDERPRWSSAQVQEDEGTSGAPRFSCDPGALTLGPTFREGPGDQAKKQWTNTYSVTFYLYQADDLKFEYPYVFTIASHEPSADQNDAARAAFTACLQRHLERAFSQLPRNAIRASFEAIASLDNQPLTIDWDRFDAVFRLALKKTALYRYEAEQWL